MWHAMLMPALSSALGQKIPHECACASVSASASGYRENDRGHDHGHAHEGRRR